MVFDEKLLTELQIKGVFAANSVLLKNFITGDNDPGRDSAGASLAVAFSIPTTSISIN